VGKQFSDRDRRRGSGLLTRARLGREADAERHRDLRTIAARRHAPPKGIWGGACLVSQTSSRRSEPASRTSGGIVHFSSNGCVSSTSPFTWTSRAVFKIKEAPSSLQTSETRERTGRDGKTRPVRLLVPEIRGGSGYEGRKGDSLSPPHSPPPFPLYPLPLPISLPPPILPLPYVV